MKKYLSKMALLVLSLAVFSGCDEEIVNYNQGDLKTLAEFSAAEGTVPVYEPGPIQTPEVYVPVSVSTVADVDRTIFYEIDAATTAKPEQYIIDPSGTVVIPAGSYFGKIKVSSVLDKLTQNVPKKLVLNLTGIGAVDTEDDNVILSKDKTQIALTILRTCGLDYNAIGINYNGTSSAFDATGNLVTYNFTPVITRVSESEFKFNTMWGEDFIGTFVGKPIYNGQFLYSGRIKINPDLTLKVIANDPWASNPTATYDTCSRTFTLTLGATLFEDQPDFVASVTLVPND